MTAPDSAARLGQQATARPDLRRLLTDADYAEYEYEQGNVHLVQVIDAKRALNEAMRSALPDLLQAEADLATALRHIEALIDPNLSGLTERSQDHERSVRDAARRFADRLSAPGGE